MKKILILFLFLMPFYAYTQNDYDRTWALGWKNKQEDTIVYGLNIIFDKEGIKYIPKKRDIIISKYNTTGNNKNGDLQFYSNGCLIYNKYDTLMRNGDKLNAGSIVTDPWCIEDEYLPVGFQCAMHLPINDSISYLLHQKIDFATGYGSVPLYLLYTKINTSGNKQQGVVVEKNKILINDILDGGHLTAVKQANGKDWWIVQPKFESGKFYIIPFTDKGFGAVKLITSTAPPDTMNQGTGGAIFSPNGKKYARYDKDFGIQLYDFNREKGIFTSFKKLSTDTITKSHFYRGGVAFSPNNRFLYVTNQFFLYQFDTESIDIQASRIEIARRTVSPSNHLILMQAAPDCKIYMTSFGGDFFHVIENPNERGLACNFKFRGLKLPVYIGETMPYFPNYRLGTPDEHWCDSLKVNNKDVEKEQFMACAVYPNPAYEQVNVDLFGYVQSYQQGNWLLYDATGKIAASFPILQGHDQYNFDIAFLPQGLHVWNLVLDGKVRQVGKLIKME